MLTAPCIDVTPIKAVESDAMAMTSETHQEMSQPCDSQSACNALVKLEGCGSSITMNLRVLGGASFCDQVQQERLKKRPWILSLPHSNGIVPRP